MPDVSAHPSSQALALFSGGKLSAAQAATVAAHLESCPVCRKAVAPDKAATARPGGTMMQASAAPPQPAAPVPDVPPELADHAKFRIIRELGRGGMGVIYLAQHCVMDKPVALKVISPAVLDNPTAVGRFLAEVRAAGKLDHPNIARAYDADRAGELHFLVMEFVEGMTLAQVLDKKGPLPIAHACHYVRQAALGLQHAFEQGMVHRDIKPQNLMLAPKSVVKVLDFGLARLRGERKTDGALTQADAFMGTPEYVAPEQATDARSADIRADVYSLGCTLCALLTGRPPFVEDTPMKLVLAHIEKEPPPLHELRPDVPAELAVIVAKMLAKEPARRYQKPVEVAQALLPFVKAGPKAAAAGGATVLATGGAGTPTVAGGEMTRRPAADPVSVGRQVSPFGDLVPSAASARPSGKAKGRPGKAQPTPALWKRPAVIGGAICGALALLVLAGLGIRAVLTRPARDASHGAEAAVPDGSVLADARKPAAPPPNDGEPVAAPPGAGAPGEKQGDSGPGGPASEPAVGNSKSGDESGDQPASPPARPGVEVPHAGADAPAGAGRAAGPADPSRPAPSELDTAREHMARAKKEARKELLSKFEATLDRLKESKQSAARRLALIDVVKAEKDRFDGQGLLPWSQPMRSPMRAYLESLRVARVSLARVYTAEIDKQLRHKNDQKVAELRAGLKDALDIDVVAQWVHAPGGGPGGMMRLYDNGAINDPAGVNSWAFDGTILSLRWPNPKAPGGAWVDTCAVSPDGKTYAGANQNKARITGHAP